MTPAPAKPDSSLFSEEDLRLFHEGTHFQIQDRLGAHLGERAGEKGCHFSVWAPAARSVAVIGSFNQWSDRDPLSPRGDRGVWETFVPDVKMGDGYKFHIVSRNDGYTVDKSDPYSVCQELAPGTASRVWDLDYQWQDSAWMADRKERQALDQAQSVYEVHLGSWARGKGGRHLSYLELAERLIPYVRDMGFTHIQLLPVLEHPFYGSWGYGATGYFAATSRYGSPQDFMAFIDQMHAEGIGILLDWVPAHFPADESALGFFDGTHLYEHADPRKGFHPDWKSLIFNLGRPEVRSFLISSALFWLDRYHLDGIRADAVSSMLYLDYSRKEGEWEPNRFGGRENLEAIDFLRKLNEEVYQRFPDVQTVAEESTSWPMVSRPTFAGGLGFGLKWDMGWMHDTLDYMSLDPLFRKSNQNLLTFRQFYSDAENFVLPLSHDEVVHGKKSLLEKMPGDEWKKFANLRLLLTWMFAQNGKKLLFMGGEFGQSREWDHESSLDWDLLERPLNRGVSELVKKLNDLYRTRPALHVMDVRREGFEWIDCQDTDSSILALIRHEGLPGSEDAEEGSGGSKAVLGVFNFTPVPRENYRIGVPGSGVWEVLLDSDQEQFGGSGYLKVGSFESESIQWHGRENSLELSLPPLAAIFLERAVTEGSSS